MSETTEQYRSRINGLVHSIGTEPAIKKMRSDIAEGIGKTGNRQADLEKEFQNVLDESTDRDFNSAPEIRAARDGTPNLNNRLIRDHNQVIAQLAQTSQEVSNLDARKSEKTEVDATNKRIDGLIIESGDANAEVTDARVSNVKNKTFTTINNRFEEIEANSHLPFYNLVKNGNFADGVSDWLAFGGEIRAENGALIHENIDSNTPYPAVYSRSDQALTVGHKIFIKCDVTNLNDNATKMQLILQGTTSGGAMVYANTIDNPPVGQKTTVATTRVITNSITGNLQFRLMSTYNSSAEAIGETFKVENVIVMNLTELFGLGNEPTDKEVELMLEKLPGKWLSNTINNSKFVLSYLNDKADFNIGSFGILYSSEKVPNFDFDNNILTLTNPRLIFKDKFLIISDSVVEIPLFTVNGNYGAIMFNTKSMIFSDNNSTGVRNASKDDILIAMYNRQKIVYMPSAHTINGKNPSYDNNNIETRITDLENTVSEMDPSNEKVYLFGNFSTMYQSPTVESMNTLLPGMTSQELYNEYDALVSANSSRFTKNLLGYGTDASGNEDTTLPIYEYVYSPRTHGSLENTPVILIQSGVHGDEKSPPWITLEFFKQLMSEWRTSEVIESIKNNITFKVIPLVNPGGFTDNTRINRNGVDINRNYSYKWDEGRDEYKGSAALSEFETKTSHDWIMSNQNALMLLDYHNSLSTGTYMVTNSEDMKKPYSSLARRLTDLWIKGYNNYNMGGQLINSWEYGWAYQDGYYVAGINYSAVIEIGAYSKENEEQYIYDSEAIGKGVELLVNNISSILTRYSR